MKRWFRIRFQDAASDYIIELLNFFDFVIVILVFIRIYVIHQLWVVVTNSYINLRILEMQVLEFFVTLLPGLVLMGIAVPSIRLIYMFDQEVSRNHVFPVKVTGYQWYWKYEYEMYYHFTRYCYEEALKDERYRAAKEVLEANLNLERRDYFRFFVTIKKLKDLNKSEMRLLEIVGELVVPINSQIQLVVTSEDVLHSWALPAIGIKVDAVPGRLNKLNFLTLRIGGFYGQCSEICGAYHSFMPTKVSVLDVLWNLRTDKNIVTLLADKKNPKIAYHF